MKKIFIGIDISKETFDASVIFSAECSFDYIQLGYEQFKNEAKGFRQFRTWVRKLTAKVHMGKKENWLLCCETTGGYDHGLCAWCHGSGLDIWRESALQIRRSSGVRRGKSDRADSLMIAEYAHKNQRKCKLWEPLPQSLCELKELLLYRERLVNQRKAAKVRANEKRLTSARSKISDYIYNSSIREVERLGKEIKECEKRMMEIINADGKIKRNYDHITSIGGVGLINATALIVFTGNFKTIDDPRKIATYFGLVTFYEDSGTSVHKKDSTKHLCNKLCKKYISNAATVVIKTNRELRQYYDRLLSNGKHKKIAQNNLKHKIIHIAFSLVMNDCDYEENHEYKRAERNKITA